MFVRLGWKSLTGTNTSLLRKFVNCVQKSFVKLGSGKTEVESSAHNPQIEGSYLGTVTGREKMAQKEVWQI